MFKIRKISESIHLNFWIKNFVNKTESKKNVEQFQLRWIQNGKTKR